MYIKLTTKRQATFPAQVVDALGVGPGDRIELIESADGWVLRPQRVDAAALAPLRGKLRRGRGSFDLQRFRDQAHDPSLRD